MFKNNETKTCHEITGSKPYRWVGADKGGIKPERQTVNHAGGDEGKAERDIDMV